MSEQKYFERKNKFPCCKTFMCLIRCETLPEGVMPKWLTKLVNWAIDG